MEPDKRIRRIAIVGGGAAGWLAAVILSRKLGGHASIHVIDAAEPPPFGHAVAGIPPLLDMLKFLGIEQNDFVDKTQATYSLGTRYLDWSAPGQNFWHAHGGFGALIERRPFYHFWHKARSLGLSPKAELFSLEVSMALAGRFIFPTNALGVATNLRYSLHADVGLVGRYLRGVAERAGVIRLERKVVSVARAEDGRIDELQFEDGGKLRADLFIDNSGLLMNELGTPYVDWRDLLPCDRIVCAPGAVEEARAPFVRATARAAGWQWRMPLQQCVSHGLVYSGAHQDDESAQQELRASIGNEPLAEPRRYVFNPGRRREFWTRNVVALGAAAGWVEPLAATDLHLASNAIFHLLDHFPDRQFDPANVASYNALIGEELERVRDFTLLHYTLSHREDSPFWRERRAVALPERLARRIDLYRGTGRVFVERHELFTDLDWFWIFEGMGVIPRDYDPLVDTIDFEQVKRLMLAVTQKISADVAAAPTHDSFFAAANARLGMVRKAAAAPAS